MWVRVAHHVIHLIREPLFLPWRVVPRLIPQQLSPRRSRLRGEELLARAEPLCGSSPLLLAYWPNPTCWNPPPPGCNAGISISERAVTFQGGTCPRRPSVSPGDPHSVVSGWTVAKKAQPCFHRHTCAQKGRCSCRSPSCHGSDGASSLAGPSFGPELPSSHRCSPAHLIATYYVSWNSTISND